MKSTPDRTRPNAGFTMLELMFGMMILLLLVGSLTQALQLLSHGAASVDVDSDLQRQSATALRSIIANLKPSGFVTVGGVGFPSLFQNGAATGAYAVNAHAPATHEALPGEIDFGPNQEIVFVQPRDADGNNSPDLDADGEMIWSPNQVSFAVVTLEDGRNVLQRRTNGGSIRTIASHVERIAFDDNASSGFTVPLRAVRVRIWLRSRDAQGKLHRHFTEAVVKLRNG